MSSDIPHIAANLLVVRMSPGNAGWVAFDDIDLPGPLYLRFRDDGGRLRVAELYLAAETGGLASQDVSDLSLNAAEALVNEYADLVRSRMNLPGPQLDVLASHWATTFGDIERQIAEGHWVASSIASQFLPRGRVRGKSEKGTPLYRVRHAARSKGWVVRETDVDFRLKSGPARGLTDDFLTDVKRAYAAAVARGERPNKAIAEQTGYQPKTVQRWVYTARQRRIMPPGRRGVTG